MGVVRGQATPNGADGYEEADGTWNQSGDGNGKNWVGDGKAVIASIYPNCQIPRYARITNAWMRVYGYGYGVPIALKVESLDEDNPPLFLTDGSNKPSLRNKIGEVYLAGSISFSWQWYSIANLTTLVQAAVNRDGYRVGNALGFTVAWVSGATSIAWLDWAAYSYGYNYLYVEFMDDTSIPAKKMAWTGYSSFVQQFIKNRIKASEPLKLPSGQLW